MKHYKYNLFSVGLAVTAMMFASCSDDFLEEKKNYDNVTPDVYNYYEGAKARLSDAYSFVLPTSNSDANYRYPCTGLADEQSKSTEEYAGFSVFVDPQNIMKSETGNSYLPDYFMGDKTNIQASVYGYIRNINDVIEGITNSTLSDDYKNEFLGQAYFLRAWRYYNLLKWYGGVPLVKDVQDPVETSFTARATTKETVEFIIEDLEKAATLLEPFTGSGGWKSSSDWGRVTTGTALALKGRVLLLWASPIFNRANDETRWTNAYNEMKADLPKIQACGYGLYTSNDNVNGSAFAKMFLQVKSPENVFVTVRSSNDVDENGYYNVWEEMLRPRNANGKGNLTPSEMIISEFPMKDGRRPLNLTDSYTKLTASEYSYEKEYPFMNRDPRFYRTFTFPGMRWAYSGNPTKANSNNPSYDSGTNYALWSYVWYTDADDAGNVDKSTCYAADNLLTNNNSVYVRKRSDDLDVSSSPLYDYSESAKEGQSFRWSGAPYIELRYAEVLLNYAEAACMAGQMSEAVTQLKAIRERVGYTGDCGLDANLSSNQAACMSAILYERQIELAYEGKRFDDLRRWMLFDGGAQTVSGAPSSWKLTGWGGNTCTWLGIQQLNGQRREKIQYRTADAYGVGKTIYESDPLVAAGVQRCEPVDLTKSLYNITTSTNDEGEVEETDNGQLATLKSWYQKYLTYKVSIGDGRVTDGDIKTYLYMQFRPEYYLLGFTSGVMTQNVNLQQTIGWNNVNTGSTGTFDPLAE